MQDFFKYKSPNFEKLAAYGFQKKDGAYCFETQILGGQFLLKITVSSKGEVKTELIDLMTDEPYTLHLVEDAAGEFVGSVREEYGRVLFEVAARCFERDVFRSEQAHALLLRAREKYGDEPEFLWERLPDAAILRRKNSGKWYAVLMVVPRNKLLKGEAGMAEVLDLRIDPVELDLLVDEKRYFRGWHMNKKHWLSVILDGSLPTEEIFELLEESWHLANK